MCIRDSLHSGNHFTLKAVPHISTVHVCSPAPVLLRQLLIGFTSHLVRFLWLVWHESGEMVSQACYRGQKDHTGLLASTIYLTQPEHNTKFICYLMLKLGRPQAPMIRLLATPRRVSIAHFSSRAEFRLITL